AEGCREQGPPEPIGHVLNEPGFPATRRAFEHDRHPGESRRFEKPDLAVDLGIERLVFQTVLFDALLESLHVLLFDSESVTLQPIIEAVGGQTQAGPAEPSAAVTM